MTAGTEALGGTTFPRFLKKNPAPTPMRTATAPVRISGILPRDPLDEDTEEGRAEDNMLLPRKSLGGDSFRTGTDGLSHVVENGGGSAAGGVTLAGEAGLTASTRPCANTSFLRASRRGTDLSALPGVVGGGDMRTSPAMSSNDGAFPDGAIVCVTVGATRGGAGAGSLGTTCGCAKTGAGGFETLVCPVDWWMPQKSFTGSTNSTSMYPFTVGRFRVLPLGKRHHALASSKR